MTPVPELVVWIGAFFLATAIIFNTGLLWRIALKVGCLTGKMTFVADKIEEHNKLVERVAVLEVKEQLLGTRYKSRRAVEQGGGHSPEGDGR